MVQEGESRVVRAVPVAEFVRHTERDFLSKTRGLTEQLTSLQQQQYDERVYRLESPGQVLERGRQMLEVGATTVAVVDAFPSALASMAPSIRAAIDRGVDVIVQAYAPIEITGADLVVTPLGADSVKAWGGEQLNIVIDGREHLVALLTANLDGVVQAVWSHSVYLSCILHAGRLCEHTVHKLLQLGSKGMSGRRVSEVLDQHRFFVRDSVPGHHELVSRLPRTSTA